MAADADLKAEVEALRVSILAAALARADAADPTLRRLALAALDQARIAETEAARCRATAADLRADRLAGQDGQLFLLIGEDLRDHPECPSNALGEGDAAIEQEPPYLANGGGAVVDHVLPGSVQGLNVPLLDGLRWHEAHVGMTGGGANGFGVVPVGLLASHEGLQVLRADDYHPVAELLELALPAEGAGTGLDLGDDVEQLVAHHAALRYQAAVAIDAVDLEHGLGDIDTERLDGHGLSPRRFVHGFTG